MFGEKFSSLINSIDLNQTEIASLAGIDATLVSRYKTGKRLPARNNMQLKKIVDGIVDVSSSAQLKRIKALCYASEDIPEEVLKQHLLQWLYTEEERQLIIENRLIFGFHEKLDYLMNTFQVSNIKLAKDLGIDASLVSRYRTGTRVPIVTNRIAEDIGIYFADLCDTVDKKIEILLMIGCKCDVSEVDEVLMEKLFAAWLRSSEAGSDEQRLEQMLKNLDAYEPVIEFPQEILHIFDTMPSFKKEFQVFYKIQGLRKAILQLLITILREPDEQVLYIFTEQSLEWLLQDEKYHNICLILMRMVLVKGNRICLIHQVNRSVEDVNEMIDFWSQMHISGQVEPYSWIQDHDSPFSHATFVVPGKYCLHSECIRGTEEEAAYFLYTSPQIVDYYFTQFKHLLAKSNKYIKVIRPNDINDLTNMLLDYGLRKKSTIVVLSGFALGTMPFNLFTDILERHSFSKKKKKELLAYYNCRFALYKDTLENQQLTEYLTFFNPKEVREGRVWLNIPEIICGEKILYTEQDYTRHISYLIELLKEHPNYRIIPLYDKKFENLMIVAKEGDSLMVTKLNEKVVSLLYEYPDMCDLLCNYLKTLKSLVPVVPYNKEAVVKELSKYLI